MVARGPSTRVIARVFATIVALCAFVYLLYLIRSVIGLVAIAAFFAMALGPAVDLLDRRWFPRAAAIVSVYLVIAAGIVGIGTLFVPPVVSGVKSLSQNAPTYIAKLRKNKQFRKYDNQYKITAKVNAEAAKLPQQLSKSAGALGSVTVSVFTTIAQLITVLTIAFFLLLDGERLFGLALRTFRPTQHAALEAMAGQIYRSVAGYVIGNLAISVIAGSVAFTTLLILGVPYAAPLAVLMAFFDLIPLVGATVGAIIIGLVTLFTDFPTATIIWVIVQLDLPADREQHPRTGRLPADRQRQRSADDRRRPDRRVPARDPRRARRDPGRRRSPDRHPAGLALPPQPGRRAGPRRSRGVDGDGHGGTVSTTIDDFS